MGPLQGTRIVVTRAVHQAEELAAPLRELGAEVLLLPAIEVSPPMDPQPLQQAADKCNSYDWILFTSANAVDAFAAAIPVGTECESKVATVGGATRERCEALGFHVVLTPKKYVAEALVEAFSEYDLHDNRILIPSAAVTRDVVPVELRKMGALVNVVEAYRNELPLGVEDRAAEILREPFPHWILFASPSAIEHLVPLLGSESLNRMRIATIGPVTTEAARQHGLFVAVEATPHTSEGLIEAVVRCNSLIDSVL